MGRTERLQQHKRDLHIAALKATNDYDWAMHEFVSMSTEDAM
jgi:hypothetical protein